MEARKEGSRVVARLHDGESLLPTVLRLVEDQGMPGAILEMGIGMLREMEIGYFTGREYSRRTLKEPRELVSLHGTITRKPEPIAHLHVATAGVEGTLMGGHLFSATVHLLNELSLQEVRDIAMARKKNPETGLWELCFDSLP